MLMGFPQDATIIEEDNQAYVYASEISHMTTGMHQVLRKSKSLKSLQLIILFT